MKTATTHPTAAASARSVSKEGVKIHNTVAAEASVPVNKVAFSSSPSSKKWGPQLLLCSIAGATTAASMTVGRWLLIETGEVLLLFADGSPDRVCHDNYDRAIGNEIDPDFASDFSFDQCNDNNEQSTLGDAGEILRAIAASPYLRSVPLILIFLSSTALVVGVILIHKEFRHCWSWIQTCQEYGEECSQQLMTVMGVSNPDELTEKMKEKHLQLKNAFWNQAEKTMDCADGLVMDDVLRKWAKMGAEFSMGVCGGVVLYSLPEEIFVDSSSGAKTARRRLIRAADPSLEQIVFRPGGMWDVLPPYLMEYLTRSRLLKEIKSEVELDGSVGSRNETEITSVGSSMEHPVDEDDTNDNDEDSSDTPLASPVPLVNLRVSRQDYVPIHHALVIPAEGGESIPGQNNDEECSRETVADALSATINDLVVSNFMGTRRRPSIEHDKKTGSQQKKELQQGPPTESSPPPSPQLQVAKFLHRTTIAASFLFLCHLRSSSSTRRTWGSAVKFLTSLGLASTAVGAGVASAVLSSNAAEFGAMASHPIVGMLYSNILDKLRVSQMCELPKDSSNRMQWIFNRLREEIRKNKRLQAAWAFMVLNAMRSFPKKVA